MKPWVWTVRIEGRRQPSLWMTHEGATSAREVERYVEQLTAKGETVIVNLTRTHQPRAVVVECRVVEVTNE